MDRVTARAEPAELAEFAVALAEGAGRLVQAGRLGGLAVGTKSTATDLVTEVDRRSERWLVEHILARRPEDAILGEEGGERAGRSGVRWVLDPIDGTVNFVRGLPHYAVSVAAEVEGVAVAGAVCNPAAGETFRAWRGGGAYLGSTRLTGSGATELATAVIGTGFGYAAAHRARQAEVVAPLLPRIADIRRFGASSLDICYVAAGRLDGFFEAALNVWDYAAASLVATEAGCVTSGLHGRPVSSQLFAVAGPDLAAALFSALESVGADVTQKG
jgi:myo-inositol-1(or 4)-monophosphatase